jgi:hypothetical protein
VIAGVRLLVMSFVFVAACDAPPANAWDAGSQWACPDGASTGNVCEQAGVSCRDATQACDCHDTHGLRWTCRSSDCPTPFGPFGGCSMPGLVCAYDIGWSCTCTQGQWMCACAGPPFDCPSTKPPPVTPCCSSNSPTPTMCQYMSTTTGAMSSCYCLGGMWSCN